MQVMATCIWADGARTQYYYFQLKTTLNECSRRSGADLESMVKISESTRSHNTNNNQPKVMRYFLFNLFLSFWLPYMCTFIWYLSSANSTVAPNGLLVVSFTWSFKDCRVFYPYSLGLSFICNLPYWLKAITIIIFKKSCVLISQLSSFRGMRWSLEAPASQKQKVLSSFEFNISIFDFSYFVPPLITESLCLYKRSS